MPSTAVASRQNAWKRIAYKYRKKDAETARKRELEKLQREKERAQRGKK